MLLRVRISITANKKPRPQTLPVEASCFENRPFHPFFQFRPVRDLPMRALRVDYFFLKLEKVCVHYGLGFVPRISGVNLFVHNATEVRAILRSSITDIGGGKTGPCVGTLASVMGVSSSCSYVGGKSSSVGELLVSTVLGSLLFKSS